MSVYKRSWLQALAWIFLLAYAAAIFWLSSKPSLPTPALFPNQDKVFHFLEYLGLAFLAAACVPRGRLRAQRRRFWIALAAASFYGVTDEIHQSFVPGRDCSVADWLADSAGAWVGAYLFLKIENPVRRLFRGALKKSS